MIAASLNGALAALRQSRATAEVRAAYDEFLQRLDADEVAAQACRAGTEGPSPATLPLGGIPGFACCRITQPCPRPVAGHSV